LSESGPQRGPRESVPFIGKETPGIRCMRLLYRIFFPQASKTSRSARRHPGAWRDSPPGSAGIPGAGKCFHGQSSEILGRTRHAGAPPPRLSPGQRQRKRIQTASVTKM